MRRLWRSALVVTGAGLVAATPATATPAPPTPTPAPPTTVSEVEELAPDSLIPVPAGCPVPAPADAVFVGTVLDKDGFIEKGTVRFQIDQLRAGQTSPYSVDGVIDIRYGPDSKYLDIDAQYLVGAAVDPAIGVLASKVAPDAPLFGGDAVIGLEDTEVECPTLDDPVQTLHVDGTPVDSGLFSPMFEDRRLLLATVGVPAAVVGVVLVGLVLLRWVLNVGFRGIFALGRDAVTPHPDRRAQRVRTHRRDDDADRDLVDAP